MWIPQLHILLPLLSIFIRSAVTTALPQNPHNHVPTIKETEILVPTLAIPSLTTHRRRGIGIGTLVPGFPDQRIHGLPNGLVGLFTDISSIRPSLPVSKVFVHFFRIAARIAAKDPRAARLVQKIDYGTLVFEIWNENFEQMVTREFTQAVSLWLLNAAQNGWTALFVARVYDRVTEEWYQIRLVTPFDLEKQSSSPWD